jgi:hypothetical protein
LSVSTHMVARIDFPPTRPVNSTPPRVPMGS